MELTQKPWYQHRAEEVGYKGFDVDVCFFPALAKRLRSKLFIAIFHAGGIGWVFPMGWTDWRYTYGHSST